MNIHLIGTCSTGRVLQVLDLESVRSIGSREWTAADLASALDSAALAASPTLAASLRGGSARLARLGPSEPVAVQRVAAFARRMPRRA